MRKILFILYIRLVVVIWMIIDKKKLNIYPQAIIQSSCQNLNQIQFRFTETFVSDTIDLPSVFLWSKAIFIPLKS